MKYLTIEEIIDHCNRQLERLPSGTNGYQEHESVRAYLQELRHFRSLGVSFDKLRDLVENCGDGKHIPVEALVGETVWVVDHHMTVTPYQITHIDAFAEDNRTYYCQGRVGTYAFDEEEFGVSVFLTQEEAKATVAKIEGGSE